MRRKRQLPSSGVLSNVFRAAVQQQPGAVEQLFALYRPLLLYLAGRRLRGRLRPKVGASDLVQLTEWKARKNFVEQEFTNRRGFHAWLLTILDNQVADVGRRYVGTQKRDISRECPINSAEAKDWLRQLSQRLSTRVAGLDALASVEEVTLALEKLPPHYRFVLKLRYFEGRSFQAIGDFMERPADAARMLHNRALARLRSQLKAPHGDQAPLPPTSN